MAICLLVTGSAGLTGAEVCRHFGGLGFELRRIEECGFGIRRRDAVIGNYR